MQVHVEVVIEGQRERQRIATIQRSEDLAAADGFGLTRAESKDLLERLHATVVREHAAELEAANSSCGGCAAAGPQGRILDRLSHGLWKAQPAEPAAVLAMPLRRAALWW